LGLKRSKFVPTTQPNSEASAPNATISICVKTSKVKTDAPPARTIKPRGNTIDPATADTAKPTTPRTF
jgi:hypothetical protein